MRKISILYFIIIHFISFAQTTDIDNFKMNYSYPSTTVPEKASLMRFEQFPNIEATGGTNITIPIHTLTLDGLNIPISLSYNTKGMRVADIASNVGLGWSLTGDGNIECQINDLNDFDYQQGVRDGGFDNPSGEYFDLLSGYLMKLSTPRADFSPDFYFINAPGFKNKFYLKNHPSENNLFTPVFFEKDNIKNDPIKLILRSNGSYYFGDVWGTYLKDFAFVNGSGFKYKFSNPIDVYTANFQGTSYAGFPSSTNLFVTNWKLTQIESPYSNKKISYEYESYTNNYKHPLLIRNDFNYEMTIGNIGPQSTSSYNNINTTEYFGVKRLKKIISDDTEIIIGYDENRTDYPGGRINTITIKNKLNDKIIKTYTFYHSYFIPSGACNDNYDCYRLRLDKINDSSVGDYEFSYGVNNSDYKFPKRSSSSIDFSGYYNGNNSNNIYDAKVYYYTNLTQDNYIPFSLQNFTPTSVSGTFDLTPNNQSLIGLLTNIIYPTGGGMKIDYENDQFNYLGANYLLGSARVKKMELSDETGILKKISYDYNLDNGNSSGLVAGFKPPSSGTGIAVVGLELLDSNTVLYSKVTEKVENKGRTESYYSNFDQYPNIIQSAGITCNNIPTNTCNNLIKEVKDLKYPYSSNMYKPDERRGRLKRKKIFDANNTLLSDTEIEYEHIEADQLPIHVPFMKALPSANPIDVPSSPYYWGNRNSYIYTYLNNIKKETKKEYFNGTVIQTEKNYIYDTSRNLLKKIDQNNPSSIITQNINYAEDKNDNLLIGANMKSVPLEIQTTKNENNVTKTISHSEIKYKSINTDKIHQSQEIQYTLDNLPQVIKSYDLYDSKGNLQQVTTNNGISTTFIWGYNQTQPIAKIEGAKLTDISQSLIDAIVSASNTDASAAANNDEATLLSALNSFRNDSTLSGYQVTTYTYDPLIGVRSITPPSGIREVYLYDTANRLKEIREGNQTGKLLKEFKYNYKN